MGYRPAWRAPLRTSQPSVLSEAFLAKRPSFPDVARQCTAKARQTGAQCRRPAMRHANFCSLHGGRAAAEKGEAERYGAKLVITRPRYRKRALAQRGLAPWPYGLPKRPDLTELGPLARGQLFEAFDNREMAPDVYRYQIRLRRRRGGTQVP